MTLFTQHTIHENSTQYTVIYISFQTASTRYNISDELIAKNEPINKPSSLGRALNSFAFWNSFLFIIGLGLSVYRNSVMMVPYFRYIQSTEVTRRPSKSTFTTQFIWGVSFIEVMAIVILLVGGIFGFLEVVNSGERISNTKHWFGFFPDCAAYWSGELQ